MRGDASLARNPIDRGVAIVYIFRGLGSLDFFNLSQAKRQGRPKLGFDDTVEYVLSRQVMLRSLWVRCSRPNKLAIRTRVKLI